jgi:hypothetical protein
MSNQNHIHKVSRRLFIEACAQLNQDIAAVRGLTVKFATEAAQEPEPDQELLDALACIEERLRSAHSAIGSNALSVWRLNREGDEP